MRTMYYIFALFGILAFFYWGIPGLMNKDVSDLALATWGLITCYENTRNAERSN